VKDWRHKYQVLLITPISFWVLFFPTYCLFYSLDGVDAFRSPHWENPVQEDLLIDLQKNGSDQDGIFAPLFSPREMSF